MSKIEANKDGSQAGVGSTSKERRTDEKRAPVHGATLSGVHRYSDS